ncbi:hypothetical protein BDV18DRAFT_159112 [Aspergillus unguis]
METELYSSIDWTFPDPSESRHQWDPSLMFPSGQEDSPAWTEPHLDLDSLLSASSYPFPEPGRNSYDHDAQIDEYGVSTLGYNVQPDEQVNTSRTSTASDHPTPQRTPITRSKKPAERKRGRPRKLIQDAGMSQEERRRAQVRNAQRAYRSRKEANTSFLKQRIAQLENTIKSMGSTVLSFGGDIVRSGALDSHPELLRPLGDTVRSCLGLPGFQSSGLRGGAAAAGLIASSQSDGRGMSIAEFIDQLRITCCYQAYLVLSNPSIPDRKIERPFRFLLGLMPRKEIASYFRDALLARAGHITLEKWDHIPLYRIGGAGTHYPRSGGRFPWVEGGSSGQSDRGDEQVEEAWFDIGDLEGYLAERGVVFAEASTGGSVSRFMQRLVRAAMCLGRSPGFRRRDVEAAADEFLSSCQSYEKG